MFSVDKIIVFASILFCLALNVGARSPIIFVPGSFCSLIEVRINTTLQPSCPKSFDNRWILLWLNVAFFEAKNIECFENVFQFVYNENGSNQFESPIGVETRVTPKSNDDPFLRGILWEYFGLDMLKNHLTTKFNYVDGVDLRSIPYDFRRGTKIELDRFVENFRLLVESTFLRNENRTVHLLSHSTGGSMTLYFLSMMDQQWKDRYVRSWISLSGNLAGEVDNIEFLFDGFLAGLISQKVMQTWDFFAWRLPEPFIYGSKRILLQSEHRNYTSTSLFDLLVDLNARDLARVFRESSTILADLPTPNVTTYCFFGSNVSTVIAYRIDSKGKLRKIFGSGDGEQDDSTNMSCQLWKDKMSMKNRLIIKGFDGVHHLSMVNSKAVLTEIDGILISD